MNQVSDGAEKFRAIFEIIYNTVGELLRQLLFRFSRAEKLILNEKGSDASDPFRCCPKTTTAILKYNTDSLRKVYKGKIFILTMWKKFFIIKRFTEKQFTKKPYCRF